MAHNPPPLPLPSAFFAAAAALTSTCSYLGYRHHNRSRHVDLPVHNAAPSATAVDWRAKGCVNITEIGSVVPNESFQAATGSQLRQ
jgi:hypothetical protein